MTAHGSTGTPLPAPSSAARIWSRTPSKASQWVRIADRHETSASSYVLNQLCRFARFADISVLSGRSADYQIVNVVRELSFVHIDSRTIPMGRPGIFLMETKRSQVEPRGHVQRCQASDKICVNRIGKLITHVLSQGFDTPGNRVPRRRMNARNGKRRKDPDAVLIYETMRAGTPVLLVSIKGYQVLNMRIGETAWSLGHRRRARIMDDDELR